MRTAGAMILAAALFAGAARADVVVLEDGTKREGRVVRQDEKQVVLEVAAGKIKMQLVLKRSEVRSITKGRTANQKLLAEMKKRRSRLGRKDAAAHLAYARWLDRQPGFGKDAHAAFKKVIAISPDNETARRRLGYYRVGRKWVRGGGAGSTKDPDPELQALRRGLTEIFATDRGVSRRQAGGYHGSASYAGSGYYGYRGSALYAGSAYYGRYGYGNGYGYGYGYGSYYYSGYGYPYYGSYYSGRLGRPILTITGRNQLGRTAKITFRKGPIRWRFGRW